MVGSSAWVTRFIRVAPSMEQAEQSRLPNGHRAGSLVCVSAGPAARPDRMAQGDQGRKGKQGKEGLMERPYPKGL